MSKEIKARLYHKTLHSKSHQSKSKSTSTWAQTKAGTNYPCHLTEEKFLYGIVLGYRKEDNKGVTYFIPTDHYNEEDEF